jgi:hypothetical protein
MATIIPFPGAILMNASRADQSRADQLFQELDSRAIGEGPSRWIAQVFAVHSENAEEWVQVAPIGAPSKGVVLRFSPQAEPAHAVAALTTWTSMPESARPGIVDVLTLLNGPSAAA